MPLARVLGVLIALPFALVLAATASAAQPLTPSGPAPTLPASMGKAAKVKEKRD